MHPLNTFTSIIRTDKTDIDNCIADALVWYRTIIQDNPALGINEFHYRLALDELLTNAFKHGNANKPDASIRVAVSNAGNTMNICVADEGEGFHEIPDPRSGENIFKLHGRGLFLLSSFGSVFWDDNEHCTRFEFPGKQETFQKAERSTRA